MRIALQVVPEGAIGVVANIDNPILVPLALADKDSSLGQVEILQAQVGHFFTRNPHRSINRKIARSRSPWRERKKISTSSSLRKRAAAGAGAAASPF